MSEPNYVTCLCRHCNGHLKFDANQLRKGETRQIECPHCHLETTLYIPVGDSLAGTKETSSSQKTGSPTGKAERADRPRSSASELALFQFTRYITLAGAILVFVSLAIAALLAAGTFMPEKPKKLENISYETVAPLPPLSMSQGIQETDTPMPSPEIAKAGAFPAPVKRFLISNQGFSLKKWFDQIPTTHRKPYLDNLAVVIDQGFSKHLSSDQMQQMVADFGDVWVLRNECAPDPNAAVQKQIYRASCISAVFGLFLALTILCLILVLLAIERNTRTALVKKEQPA